MQVEICRGASHRYTSLSTLEIYEAIYKLAVIVSHFGTKLSSKSKRLPAFIKHQTNPGNRPLAAFPPLRRTTRRSLLLPLPSPNSVPALPLYASAIPLRQCDGATRFEFAGFVDDKRKSDDVRRLVFSKQRVIVRSKHAMSKAVKFFGTVTFTNEKW